MQIKENPLYTKDIMKLKWNIEVVVVKNELWNLS